MEIDQPEDETSRKSDILRNLSSNGPLPISVAKLSGSSRIIPAQEDFHFYNNFQEFKNPVAEIDEKSKSLLKNMGASENLFGKPILLPDDKDVELDEDLAFEWLENVNDEIYERFDVSLDEFKKLRKKEEESGVRTMRVDDEENGFQMVYGRKNKKNSGGVERNVEGLAKLGQEVKVAVKVKPKVPFHIPTIPKPQDEYKIIVNNSNQPFEHVWLQKSEDESRFLHPLEKLSVLDFVDTSDCTAEPEKPLPLEVTPFKLVEEVKDLKQLAIKLRSVNEFAVDLEHNQYRSFQGLTCLMQISTRTEDFVIDTLKLRIHIGPYLRDLFKDPTKRKVMHGADRDIFWLQRDFGIYVCNMFDTGQASRVLKMERYSLEHLLNHFCGVQANKQYQNADWRIRPLPVEMVKYAREDTHYLLYIYDLMRLRLLGLSAESESSDPPLIEVYKRSYDICTQLYEKELLTDTSYLYIYGLQDAEFNAQQLAVVSGLCEWRDIVARAEDESTGYILPNRTLIEIAKQTPLTANQLRRALKAKHPYIERNLSSVVSVIRHSIQNAAAFEEACKYLKERRVELSREASTLAPEESEVLPSEAPEISKVAEELENLQSSSLPHHPVIENSLASIQHKEESRKVNEKGKMDDSTSYHGATSPACGDSKFAHTATISSHSAEATVETLKKPTRAFGALFGNSAKRKFDPDKSDKEDSKLEQIKATVSLPFRAFSGGDEKLRLEVEESAKISEVVQHQENPSPPATDSTLVDIIVLDDDSDTEDSEKANSDAALDNHSTKVENNEAGSSEEDEPMSLSELSSSFQKCFPSLDQAMSSKVVDKSRPLEVQPFDYEAARKHVKFGKDAAAEPMVDGDGSLKRRERRKGSAAAGKDDGASEHPQGRRRQAFPASGNRSATFR
ncbi:Polynucleotidyl transferase [Perilla frutescens var. hirtella]|uniref:Polynucleotidyl transferase n=1 Tax=Perilla frutescens var. hirtella TaxID=608512 RepID=A0AAD4P522_PERFH|nr:Polynucleotidyl transferase [Perilla frutescens var. hirtella]